MGVKKDRLHEIVAEYAQEAFDLDVIPDMDVYNAVNGLFNMLEARA